MAYDAGIIGTCGCLPKYYPEALKLVMNGKIQLKPFIETKPLSSIKEAFVEAHGGKLLKRLILTPDF
jgi:6-hydroxycyclohex-1-ene-1-carbonyl-CoA dehydrogenase